MDSLNQLRRCAISASLLLIAIGSAAQAQEMVLEEVIVYAQKRVENVQDLSLIHI